MNSFGSRATLKAAGSSYEIFRLDALERRGLPIARLPYSLKILLENLLRREDGKVVQAGAIEKLARWEPMEVADEEIAFMPARVLLQDFTGVPAVVDLAAMRDAMVTMGGDPKRVNPLLPAELRSASCPRACCCKTSPASPPWWISPRCATRWSRWVATPSA